MGRGGDSCPESVIFQSRVEGQEWIGWATPPNFPVANLLLPDGSGPDLCGTEKSKSHSSAISAFSKVSPTVERCLKTAQRRSSNHESLVMEEATLPPLCPHLSSFPSECVFRRWWSLHSTYSISARSLGFCSSST